MLSHAGKKRPALLAEQLFWEMLDHLQGLAPDGPIPDPIDFISQF